MSFAQLYADCQGLPVPVSRADIKQRVCTLTNTPDVKLFRDGLNAGLLRGYYISARNHEHQFVKQNQGRPVIVVARGLNQCWERFVVVKELMHLFDDPVQSLGTGPEFETLLVEFTVGHPTRSPAMHSEIRCFWMALALLCPGHVRQDLQQRRSNGELTDIEIARQLRIPEQYVGHLFDSSFNSTLQTLLQV